MLHQGASQPCFLQAHPAPSVALGFHRRMALHDAWAASAAHRETGRLACQLASSALHAASSAAPPMQVAAPSERASTSGELQIRQPEELTSWLEPPPPPAPSPEFPAWSDDVRASPLDIRRRIFCNRSLNMAKIKAIGLDMDYTMAQYKPETFEVLAYNETVKKLVTAFGYPVVLSSFKFDWRYMMRGLIIDKRRGNVLKVDRHKYVKIAYHGFRPLSRAERLATYADARERFEFDEPDFALIDTLFSLAEAHLFMQLVELADVQPHSLPPGKCTADMYRDVRAAVDMCHRDGSLKRGVAADPGRYIHEDKRLAPLLEAFRASGRRVFLATNSLWDYTHVVMSFLLTGQSGAQRTEEWLSFFDAVITGCGKPDFFLHKQPLFAVHTATGMLYNTDGGAPTVPLGADALPEPSLPVVPQPGDAPRAGNDGAGDVSGEGEARPRARAYQGGFFQDLHRMLGVASGAEVLYIGDHIYGDILRSKKTLGWRTMLVVPELESELAIQVGAAGVPRTLRTLRKTRDALEDEIQRLQWAAAHGTGEPSSPPLGEEPLADRIARLAAQRDSVKERHSRLLAEHHARFHPVWGQLLKTGYQNSRYAHQMERFACLYTSHVANLAFYSPSKSYRGRMDQMAHDEEPVFSDLPPITCLDLEEECRPE